MKELIDLLDAKERRILALICILLSAAFIFHSAFARHEKKTYFRSVESLPSQQREYEKALEQNQKLKTEWLRWDEARREIPQVEKVYFYREEDVANEVRLDLRKIFQVSDVRCVSDLRFDYREEKTEKTNRVGVRFTLAGSYYALKKFIFEVERYPKFLMIEKINFEDISDQGGEIELVIILAGYYES
jgi:Tfp pilus assembly protein PilO